MIANKWAEYQELLRAGKSEKDALDELGIRRYCCRRMILTHVDLLEKRLPYSRTDQPDDPVHE
jgi:DNA-directed RNA polymerase I, II, and III subunit RPABC5